jgi:hypothetical protein
MLALVVSTGFAQPAAAHNQRRLSAKIVSAQVACDQLTYPYCSVEGKVRIKNKRAKGTKPIVICVGIDVHTKKHKSLSVEPPLPGGQAVAYVKRGKSKVTTYRTVFDASGGTADHVHVTHVHKHVFHTGGKQC